MSQHNHDNKVKEIFPALLSDSDVMNGVGAVFFVRKDKKIGKIFLRQGNVYGVDNPNVKLDLPARLTTSKYASEEDIATIRKSRQTVEKLIETVTTKQYVKPNDMTNILKENFLGSVDELYTWEDVNIEWRAGEQHTGVTVPQVALSRLVDISMNRYQHVIGQVQQWEFDTIDELFNAPYFIIGDVNPDDSSFDPINKVILTADKNKNIINVAKEAGVPPFVIIQSLIALEKNKLITYDENVANNSTVALETVEVTSNETDTSTEIREDILSGKHTASEKKGTTQMTYPSTTSNNFDVINLVTQLKDGLHKQQSEISASNKRIVDYSQEISGLQAQIASLQVKSEAEKAVQKDLQAQYDYARKTIKDLGIND